MGFAVGDRVVMLKHADWKAEATGTVVSPAHIRPQSPEQGSWYRVEFDEPQHDLTDEMQGNPKRSYSSATVPERFLRPLARG